MLPPLLQFLVNDKTLSAKAAEKLAAAYAGGGKSLDELLLATELVEEKLLAAKAEFYHLPSIDLATMTIPRGIFDLLPREIIKNYQTVIFAVEDGAVRVAMVNPENIKAREAIEFLSRQNGWDTQFYVATGPGLKHVLDQYGNLSSEVKEALVYTATKSEKEKEESPLKEKDLEEVIKSAPVSKMVNVILRHAVEGGASDIHIEPGSQESRVRYRIDGQLHVTLTLPKYIHSSIVSRIKVLANLKIDETRKPQDGRIHFSVGDREVDFRVSTLPLVGNEKVVMRILDVSRGAPTLSELGYMGRNLELIEKNIYQSNGLLLITGPTGCGKSTTLFSALSILNKENVNIVTLEDPVEYFVPGANQAQIRPEVGFTFASGLRSILRQDPNIIMVGEIRDSETAELSVQAALTGHIVLATLHTNDALGAIPRLLDMKTESFLLSSTVNMLVAQRLVRKNCPHCLQSATLTPDLQKFVEQILPTIPPASIYPGVDFTKKEWRKGKGCAKCGNIGYKGRIGICEVVKNTKKMQEIISKGFDVPEARKELIEQGFISMAQDGVMKAILGLTTMEEVILSTKE